MFKYWSGNHSTEIKATRTKAGTKTKADKTYKNRNISSFMKLSVQFGNVNPSLRVETKRVPNEDRDEGREGDDDDQAGSFRSRVRGALGLARLLVDKRRITGNVERLVVGEAVVFKAFGMSVFIYERRVDCRR